MVEIVFFRPHRQQGGQRSNLDEATRRFQYFETILFYFCFMGQCSEKNCTIYDIEKQQRFFLFSDDCCCIKDDINDVALKKKQQFHCLEKMGVENIKIHRKEQNIKLSVSATSYNNITI